jgi:signal transduction histidine kinase
MSEWVRIIALLGPVTLATAVTALFASRAVARAGLAATLVAIATVASLITVADLVVLNHFMLISPNNRAEVGAVAVYSLTAGVVAALIVGRSTTRALDRLSFVAGRLGENDLDARVGELRASPELRQVGAALDLAAERISLLIETERRTEAARRDLMTAISHDLRTPLANLRAMVEAIDEGVVDDPGIVREYAGEMLRSTDALVAMVEDLFALSQVDGAAFRADATSIGVAEAVRDAVDLCSGAARRKSIRVETDLDGAHGARCPAKMARVVQSLVDNAVRYTPEGGTVTVTAVREDDGLVLTVDDSGGGLTAEQRRMVFDPFWRADSARSSRGSGLGLTLAQRITHALGGEIQVSQAPAGGSRFQVVVPPAAGRASGTV